jgi:hypothetical protein
MRAETSRPSQAVAKTPAVTASTPLTPAAETMAVMFSALGQEGKVEDRSKRIECERVAKGICLGMVGARGNRGVGRDRQMDAISKRVGANVRERSATILEDEGSEGASGRGDLRSVKGERHLWAAETSDTE